MRRENIYERTKLVLMASVMCLHFSMQEEDILQHTN